MTTKLLDPDRLLPIDPSQTDIARDLYSGIKTLPIVSPHGHTDPSWFSHECFNDATNLLSEVIKTSGHCDMLVNGAGSFITGGDTIVDGGFAAMNI